MAATDHNRTMATATGDDPERPVGSDILEALSGIDSGAIRRDKLVRTIESEIIPRLMVLHSGPNAPSLFAFGCASEEEAAERERTGADVGTSSPDRPDRSDGKVSEMDVAAFSTVLVEKDVATAREFVEGLLRDGMHWEDLLLNLMQPAARRLGEDWKEDRRDFTEVTFGLGMLQKVLRESNPITERIPRRIDENRRIFLAAIPGEQHTFGLLMVEDFFRRAGWDVHIEASTSLEGLMEVVRRDWYSAVGITMGSETLAEAMTSLIGSLRKGSRNPNMGIVVGGPAFVVRPELADMVGADALALDGLQAISEADRITKQTVAAD